MSTLRELVNSWSINLNTNNIFKVNETNVPYGIAFNNNGTKMFIIGFSGRDVNEYTLSTGFDVSTASFVDSFDVSTQDNTPVGIAFNNDGSKMFIIGKMNAGVNEYTLSTEFDVSTANFNQNFSVSSQTQSPEVIAFNNDGTKMFILESSSSFLIEYSLSTGFDLGSTIRSVHDFDTSSQETLVTGIAFNNDGTKMFIVGYDSDNVNEYTLSTGFDLTTIPTILKSNYSLYNDLTIGTGQTLTIASGKTLTIPSGLTLINNGIVINEGTLVVAPGGTLTNNNIVLDKSDNTLTFNSDGGTSQTLNDDFTIASGQTLTIASGGTLDISSGENFINNGTLTNNGTFINILYGTYTPPIICFPANTPVTTDQGYVPIQDLENKPYTIEGNKVLGIVSMTSNEAMVYFKQHSLGYNVPSKNTYITQSHVIYHNNTQLKAIDYTKKDFHKRLCSNSLKGIKQEKPILVKVENNKVYNVLLENGHKMKVNNMLVETLHPSNELYKQKLLK